MPFRNLTSKAAILLYAIVSVFSVTMVACVSIAKARDINANTTYILITSIIGFGGVICTSLFGQLTAQVRSEANEANASQQREILSRKVDHVAESTDKAAEKAEVAAVKAAAVQEQAEAVAQTTQAVAETTRAISDRQIEIAKKVDGNLEQVIKQTAEEVRISERAQLITQLLADEKFRELVRFIVRETCKTVETNKGNA